MVLRPPGLGCNNSIRLSIYFNNIFRKSLYKWLYKFQVIDEKFIVLVLDSEQDKELAASSPLGKILLYDKELPASSLLGKFFCHMSEQSCHCHSHKIKKKIG